MRSTKIDCTQVVEPSSTCNNPRPCWYRQEGGQVFLAMMMMGCNTAEGQEGVGGDASDLSWEEVTAACTGSDVDVDLGVEPITFQAMACGAVDCAPVAWKTLTGTVLKLDGCGDSQEIIVRYYY
ncbi:MAG: hypothetical protein ACI8RZ_003470 [Myxococcota bacterium]